MKNRVLLTVGLVVAALFFVSTATSDVSVAYAVAGDHRAMVGLATQSAYILQDEQSHGTPAYDLQIPGANPTERATNTTNVSVYAQTRYYSGGEWRAYKDSYISGSGCEGVAVIIKNASSSGSPVGRQEYVHIDVSGSIPTDWLMDDVGWSITYLGYVKGYEDCSWTTPHLHQADETYGSGKTNSDVDTGETWSTGTSSDWLFQYTSS
ncbi:MAG: hypothetical protein C4558_00870 [Dehalococcoidia bacterium]|nr:MAG: hypothetical protein C4558_00870 [Dehalococcoidia bacterium]